MPKTLQTPLR